MMVHHVCDNHGVMHACRALARPPVKGFGGCSIKCPLNPHSFHSSKCVWTVSGIEAALR